MDKFISISNFKHLFKLLNIYSENTYNKKLDFKTFKKIIGNTMYEINNNFKDKITRKKKNIMLITVIKQIIDEKNQVEDFFKVEDNNFNNIQSEIKRDNIYLINNVNNLKENKIEQKEDINILEKKLYNERLMYEKIINTEEQKIDMNIIQKQNIEDYMKNIIIEKPITEKINLEDKIKNINQDILISPEEYKKTIQKYIKYYDLLIDSRDRNIDQYDNNNYIIDLNKELKNIFSVELLHGIFPNSEYLVNFNNNILHIEEQSGNIVEVEIPIGNYNKTELIQTIENSLNNNINLSSDYKIETNNVSIVLNSIEQDDSNFIEYTGTNIESIFDNNLSNYWTSNLASDNPSYFIYDFKKEVLVKEYSFLSNTINRPKDYKLEISNDNINWNNIHDVTNQIVLSNKYKTYKINNNYFYSRYIRFSVTNTTGGNNVIFGINEMEFKTYRDDIISIESNLIGTDQNYFNLYFFGGYNINNQKIYRNRSIGNLIGYDPIDLTNKSNYPSQNKIILKNDQNIILNINNNIDFHITLESEKNSYTYIKEDTSSYLKLLDKLEYNTKINKLHINIKRINNNLYHFNGLEHSFLLRFYYYDTNQIFSDSY